MSRMSRRAARQVAAAEAAAQVCQAENERLRAEKTALSREAEALRVQLRETSRLLYLSEGARLSLDRQIRAEHRSLDYLCREAVDRAGTLAPVPAKGGASGE
ncbi:hypothetical protein AB0D45_02815 [Streptomyces sp. NPDC048352]|uniref:hypothetical protein n=1 Tax=Streptomyces sp. NPDC048352 TaxID=3154718 RepID=UPI0034449A4D